MISYGEALGTSCMIENLFCFRGRIGRLKYFLWSFIFGPAAFLLAMLILPFIFVFGLHLDGSKTTALMTIVPAITVFLWTQLSLKAARIRDIGWKPLVIIPALLSIDAADLIVAYLFPALAIGTKHFTALSELVNAAFTLALLFTPSDGDDAVPTITFPEIPLPNLTKRIVRDTHLDSRPPVTPPRSSYAAPRPTGARGQVSFGRRGLN